MSNNFFLFEDDDHTEVGQFVEAGSRKLQAGWTIEAMQDLKAQHGLDLEGVEFKPNVSDNSNNTPSSMGGDRPLHVDVNVYLDKIVEHINWGINPIRFPLPQSAVATPTPWASPSVPETSTVVELPDSQTNGHHPVFSLDHFACASKPDWRIALVADQLADISPSYYPMSSRLKIADNSDIARRWDNVDLEIRDAAGFDRGYIEKAKRDDLDQ